MISKKIILCSFILLCCATGIFKIIISLPSGTHENDFAHYYISSRGLVEHQDVYNIELKGAYERYDFVYGARIPRPTNPPLLLWIFAPFALMSPSYAFWSWVFIQVVCFLAIIWMMKKILTAYASKLIWPLSCAILLVSSTLWYNFVYSQIQLPILAMILGAYLLHKQNRPLLTLTLVSTAGMIKLYPLVFVPWFIWRITAIARKRAIYALYVVFLASGIVWATGPNLWIDFFDRGMPVINNTAINAGGNYSLPSFVINLGYSLYGFLPPLNVKKILIISGGLAGVALIFLVYASCFRAKGRRDMEFGLLCIVAILSSITAWTYYLVFLLFPFSLAFSALQMDTPWKRILFMIILAISVTAGAELALPRHQPFHIYQLPLYYLPMFAMFVLGGFLFFELRKSYQKI